MFFLIALSAAAISSAGVTSYYYMFGTRQEIPTKPLLLQMDIANFDKNTLRPVQYVERKTDNELATALQKKFKSINI